MVTLSVLIRPEEEPSGMGKLTGSLAVVVMGASTVMVKVQELEFPLLSVAVQVTRCRPAAKVEPLGGTHATFVTAQLSVALAA